MSLPIKFEEEIMRFCDLELKTTPIFLNLHALFVTEHNFFDYFFTIFFRFLFKDGITLFLLHFFIDLNST